MQQGMTYTVTAAAATNASPTSALRDLRHLQQPLGGGARQPRRLRRRDRPQGRRPLRVARQRRRPRLLVVRGQHGLPLQRGHRPGDAGRHRDLLEAERPRRLLLQPDALRRLERRLPGLHQPGHLPPCRRGRRREPGLHDRERRLREPVPGLAARLLLHAHRAGQPDRHLPAAAHAALHPRLEPREHGRLSHDRHPVRSRLAARSRPTSGTGPTTGRPIASPATRRTPTRTAATPTPPTGTAISGTCRSSTTCCCPTSSRGGALERRRHRHPRERQRRPRRHRRSAQRGRLLAAPAGRQRLLARPHEPERQQPAVPGRARRPWPRGRTPRTPPCWPRPIASPARRRS